jgi:hypothetical protein
MRIMESVDSVGIDRVAGRIALANLVEAVVSLDLAAGERRLPAVDPMSLLALEAPRLLTFQTAVDMASLLPLETSLTFETARLLTFGMTSLLPFEATHLLAFDLAHLLAFEPVRLLAHLLALNALLRGLEAATAMTAATAAALEHGLAAATTAAIGITATMATTAATLRSCWRTTAAVLAVATTVAALLRGCRG